MVKLRLTRMGSINKPFYRIVAVDSRARRDGRYLDNIGYYDPKHDPAVINLDVEKALKWLKVGAQPTETVNSLFRKAGVLKKWHELRFVKKETVATIDALPEPPKEKKVKLKKEATQKAKIAEDHAVVESTVDKTIVSNAAELTGDEVSIEQQSEERDIVEIETNIQEELIDIDTTE